jgi:integrase/recombinase XerD
LVDSEEQLQKVLNTCTKSLDRLIITMLSSTGLRASEFCDLKMKDINLEKGYLVVERGKGGKRRRVGMSGKVTEMLRAYLQKHPTNSPEDYVFKSRFGARMERDGLLNRVRRIGSLAGIEITPHVLRRAFVTINANKGRSLVMLQMACGHSDIKTTRSYCKTSEDEMIQAMKDW